MLRCIRQSGRRGFTIAELLIVMGIIAILISFLIPTIAKSRAKAELTAYQAVMRQNAALLQMYCDGNEGVYPLWKDEQEDHEALDAASTWYGPMQQAGLIKRFGELDPLSAKNGTGMTISMSVCLVYEARKLLPGVPKDDKATPVRDAQVLYPSRKGTLYRWTKDVWNAGIGTNGWYTLTRPWQAPVAMADGSILTGTAWEFTSPEYGHYIEEGTWGAPVYATWRGYLGRDR